MSKDNNSNSNNNNKINGIDKKSLYISDNNNNMNNETLACRVSMGFL